jgi:hypothetical protein
MKVTLKSGGRLGGHRGWVRTIPGPFPEFECNSMDNSSP